MSETRLSGCRSRAQQGQDTKPTTLPGLAAIQRGVQERQEAPTMGMLWIEFSIWVATEACFVLASNCSEKENLLQVGSAR